MVKLLSINIDNQHTRIIIKYNHTVGDINCFKNTSLKLLESLILDKEINSSPHSKSPAEILEIGTTDNHYHVSIPKPLCGRYYQHHFTHEETRSFLNYSKSKKIKPNAIMQAISYLGIPHEKEHSIRYSTCYVDLRNYFLIPKNALVMAITTIGTEIPQHVPHNISTLSAFIQKNNHHMLTETKLKQCYRQFESSLVDNKSNASEVSNFGDISDSLEDIIDLNIVVPSSTYQTPVLYVYTYKNNMKICLSFGNNKYQQQCEEGFFNKIKDMIKNVSLECTD